jgi:NAD(P)-dependent dehydrogenase (short-subunit alcohol dehydrogenase family)
VQDLVASGKVPTRIAHLWLVTAQERFRPGSSFFHQNLQDGFYSLFFLAQALGDENVPTPLHIDVVSNGMQGVDDEAVAYPEKATALGPVKVIPRELPGVTCRSIDVRLPARPENTLAGLLASFRKRGDDDGESLDSVAALLEDELLGEASCQSTAHRGRERFVRHYRAERLMPARAGEKSGLREGGTYLITGGLGGLGLTMAERLATELKAKLVLVGRTPLPEREEWDDWLRSRGGDDSVGRKIRKVQELERAGAEVLVLAGDVTNHDQMRDIFQTARARFGGINGVLHTAGLVKDELIQLVDPRLRRFILGDTDSEAIFYLFLTYLSRKEELHRPGADIENVSASMRETIETIQEMANTHQLKDPLLTLCVTDGILMVASRYGKELHRSSYKKRCPERDTCPSLTFECENPSKTGYVSHFILSSEPLQGHNVWEPLADGDVIGCDWRMHSHQWRM